MEMQWGKNSEYTVHLWHDLSYWTLPLSIGWRYNKQFMFITIKVLCFGFMFEIWS